jgi:polysaccharide pyruvyl transferase WcaK-like protein
LGLFGSGNSGNDGSLEAMLLFLRRVEPEAELVCFCASNHGATARVARDFQLAATPLALPKPAGAVLRILDRLSFSAPRQLASMVRAIRHTRRLDLLIVPGTGILDDFQSGPAGMPLALFGWCLAARLCGTRIAFVSIGAGPIRNSISRWLMKSAVTMAQYRSYRDTVSKAFMESIGFDTRNDAVFPDLAFKLPEPASCVRPDTEDRLLIVGVGVMTYLGWRNGSTLGPEIYAAYLEKITTFVLWLLNQDHRVRLLMGHAADRQAVADVMTKVASARPDLPQDRLLAEPMSSLHDLMRQVVETDVVVATRFHNVVCALKLCKPTVSIGYAEKFDDLMAEMGVGCFCQHVERLDVDLLIEQFERLTADRRSHENSIRRTNLRYQEYLELQDELLASRFF